MAAARLSCPSPLLRRRMPVRAVLRLALGGARRRRVGSGSGLLSWGSFKDRPSASTNAVRPLPGGPRSSLRPGVANLQARSALAVPPGSDGLLRSASCRSIAPCNRPWGSPCFGLRSLCPPKRARRLRRPRWRRPYEAFPSLTAGSASPRGRALSPLDSSSARLVPVLPPASGPLRRYRRPQGFDPPENPLLMERRCRRTMARCSHGLAPL